MKTKEARRQRRREKRDERQGALREAYHDVLRRTGLDVDELPAGVREFLGARGGFGRGSIVRFADGQDDPGVRDEVLSALDRRRAWAGLPAEVSPLELLTVVAHALHGLGRHCQRFRGDPRGWLAAVRHLLEVWGELAEELALETAARLDPIVVARSRLDAALYTAAIEGRPEDEGCLEVVIGRTPAERRMFELEGLRRPAFRVATRDGLEEVRWLEWDSTAVGLPGPRRSVPVYVQAHALEQLAERLSAIEREGDRQAILARSLAEPVVTRRFPSGDLLVEYRLADGKRLGHLVVSATGGAALVRTFLFLTMEGTPEGERLKRRLRLGRRDVEYLALNRLATFFGSDLKGDPELRAHFDACGCGHLFAIRGRPGVEEETGVAGEVRRYLGLNRAG